MVNAEASAEVAPGAPAARAQPLRRPLAVAYMAEAESEGVLRSLLGELDGGIAVQRGGIQAAIRDLARSPTPQVLIVDVSGAPDPLVALDDLAGVCEPDVRLIVVGERTDVGFYREITRGVGALEYLGKPLTRDAVTRLVLPVLKGRVPGGEAPAGGRIITVTAARGGAGATTVAANLAVQVADASRGHVALVDLNLRNGATAITLGVAQGAGLRVALEEPGRVDELFLERSAVSVSDRLRLIAADEPLEAEPRPTAEGVARLAAMLKRRFNQIIVDMPNPADPVLAGLYGVAATRLLVIAPDVASLHGARRFRAMLSAVTGNDEAVVVLNHAGCPGALPARVIEQGLAGKPAAALPHLPKQVAVAANLGVPAVTRSRDFAAAMLALTREVAGIRTPRAGWLARLFQR